MRFHFQQAIRAMIFLFFAIFLFHLHLSGEIVKYTNPKYNMLSQITAFIFLFLFLVQITRVWTNKKQAGHNHCCHEDHVHSHDCVHDHGYSKFTFKKLISYSIIVFPLLSAYLLPAKTLDASIVNKKGGMLLLSRQESPSEKKAEEKEEEQERIENNDTNELENSTDDIIHDTVIDDDENIMSKGEFEGLMGKLNQGTDIVMRDDVYSSYFDEISYNIEKFKGRNISLKGFVYKEDDFKENQLVISRFLVTHCVADASLIGFLSELPKNSQIPADTWVEAEGIIDKTTYNGMELPLIKITKWKKIKEKEEPYVYPVSIEHL